MMPQQPYWHYLHEKHKVFVNIEQVEMTETEEAVAMKTMQNWEKGIW